MHFGYIRRLWITRVRRECFEYMLADNVISATTCCRQVGRVGADNCKIRIYQ